MATEPVLVLARVDGSGATLVKYSELSTESGLRVRAGGAGHGWRGRVDSGAAHLRDMGLHRLTRAAKATATVQPYPSRRTTRLYCTVKRTAVYRTIGFFIIVCSLAHTWGRETILSRPTPGRCPVDSHVGSVPVAGAPVPVQTWRCALFY